MPLTMFTFRRVRLRPIFDGMEYPQQRRLKKRCRYALVNNTDSNIVNDVTTLVTGFMAGQNVCFTYQGLPGVGVSISGIDQGTTYTGPGVNTLVAGDMITVSVTGTYTFLNIIPYVKMPASVTITSAVTMVCEGAM